VWSGKDRRMRNCTMQVLLPDRLSQKIVDFVAMTIVRLLVFGLRNSTLILWHIQERPLCLVRVLTSCGQTLARRTAYGPEVPPPHDGFPKTKRIGSRKIGTRLGSAPRKRMIFSIQGHWKRFGDPAMSLVVRRGGFIPPSTNTRVCSDPAV
jgi:hypothetical protein